MIRISIRGKRVVESAGESVPLEFWNENTKNSSDWIKKGYPNAALINLNIQNKVNELQKRFLLDKIEGRDITRELAQEKMRRNAAANDFFQTIERFSAAQKNRGTRNNCNYYVSQLKEWYPDLRWRDFSPKWLEAYRLKLAGSGNSHNTIWAKFKFLHQSN